MKSMLIAAFDATCQGFSPDRVVADPELNSAFIAEAARLEITGSATELNRNLLNLRKQGDLPDRNSKRTSFSDEGDYRFAAEMAIRFLERRDGISLDAIICDPALAAEFDSFAAKLAPGYSPLQYRWAALNLRKMSRLKPELLARVAPPTSVDLLQVNDIEIRCVPTEQGLYIFFTSNQVLYVGEAENLNKRLKKHFEHSDNKGLARWMWEFGTDDLRVEIQTLATNTATKVRRALETELIRSRSPLFNVKR
jgi:predicted GIY-YIG superfamily endonuclease